MTQHGVVHLAMGLAAMDLLGYRNGRDDSWSPECREDLTRQSSRSKYQLVVHA